MAWNLANGKPLETMSKTLSSELNWMLPKAMCFYGNLFVCGEKPFAIYDVKEDRLVCIVHCHKMRLTSLAFSPCGQWLASAGYDGDIFVFDVSKFSGPDTHDAQTNNWIVASFSTNTMLKDVSFSPCGRFLMASRKDGGGAVMYVYSTRDWKLVCRKFGVESAQFMSRVRHDEQDGLKEDTAAVMMVLVVKDRIVSMPIGMDFENLFMFLKKIVDHGAIRFNFRVIGKIVDQVLAGLPYETMRNNKSVCELFQLVNNEYNSSQSSRKKTTRVIQ